VIIWNFNSHISNYIENSTRCNRSYDLINVRNFTISLDKNIIYPLHSNLRAEKVAYG